MDDDKSDEEERLETILFGDGSSVFEQTPTDINENKSKVVKRKPVWTDDYEKDTVLNVDSEKRYKLTKLSGEHELNVETYKERLSSNFKKTYGSPSWAELDHIPDKVDDESEALLKHAADCTVKPSLTSASLDFIPCPPGNQQVTSKGRLRTAEFHPRSKILLTASADCSFSLFQVDGKSNRCLQTVFTEKFPIFDAHFSADGNEVFLSSKLRTFRYFDLLSGKLVTIPKFKCIDSDYRLSKFQVSGDGNLLAFSSQNGYIFIVSAKSKQLITTLRSSDEISALAFSSDGSKLISHSYSEKVYVWEMKTRDCVHSFDDSGVFKGTAISLSTDGNFLATGSYSGVCNLYNFQDCLTSESPKSVKAFTNLVSPCDIVKFNGNSELMCIGSSHQENAIKMIHVANRTVFPNFPERQHNIRIPYCVDFSTNSGYLTVGNHKGKALLFRLRHYDSY